MHPALMDLHVFQCALIEFCHLPKKTLFYNIITIQVITTLNLYGKYHRAAGPGAQFLEPAADRIWVGTLLVVWLSHVGGCQNYGPCLGTLNIRCRIIIRTQKGTIILTTTHMDSKPVN